MNKKLTIMDYYCSICGKELDPDEESIGICEGCELNDKYLNILPVDETFEE